MTIYLFDNFRSRLEDWVSVCVHMGCQRTAIRQVSNKPFPYLPYMAPYMGLYGPLWPHKEVSLISKMVLTRLGTLQTGQWSSQDGLGIQM